MAKGEFSLSFSRTVEDLHNFSRTVEDLHKMNKDAHTFGISRSRQEY